MTKLFFLLAKACFFTHIPPAQEYCWSSLVCSVAALDGLWTDSMSHQLAHDNDVLGHLFIILDLHLSNNDFIE